MTEGQTIYRGQARRRLPRSAGTEGEAEASDECSAEDLAEFEAAQAAVAPEIAAAAAELAAQERAARYAARLPELLREIRAWIGAGDDRLAAGDALRRLDDLLAELDAGG